MAAFVTIAPHLQLAPSRQFLIQCIRLGTARAFAVEPVLLVVGRTAVVQLLHEMLAAILIILVALDARLDLACVGLARIRVGLIGHVQLVRRTPR